jgi:hypothetical protein
MDAVTNADTTFRLGEAIGGAAQLVQIASKLERRSLEESLRPLIEQTLRLGTLVRDGFHAFLRMSDNEQTLEQVEYCLLTADLIATKLEELVTEAARIESTGAAFPNWLNEGLSRERELAEDLRDIEETLALGQSDAFQQDIDQAKKEALR